MKKLKTFTSLFIISGLFCADMLLTGIQSPLSAQGKLIITKADIESEEQLNWRTTNNYLNQTGAS